MPHDSHRKSVHIVMIVLLSLGFYALRAIQPDTATAETGHGSAVVGSIKKLDRIEYRAHRSHQSSVSTKQVSN